MSNPIQKEPMTLTTNVAQNGCDSGNFANSSPAQNRRFAPTPLPTKIKNPLANADIPRDYLPSILNYMPLANRSESALVIVDLQPKFLAPVVESGRVLGRAEFMIRLAGLMGVPILASEQYPVRMGGTDSRLQSVLSDIGSRIVEKMTFSCVGCDQFDEWLAEHSKTQIILVGIETHICVNQTAHHLLQTGHEVFIAEDAMSARSELMHFNGIARMKAAGAVLAHTESIAYEWLRTAEDPQFRQALDLVKAFGSHN